MKRTGKAAGPKPDHITTSDQGLRPDLTWTGAGAADEALAEELPDDRIGSDPNDGSKSALRPGFISTASLPVALLLP